VGEIVISDALTEREWPRLASPVAFTHSSTFAPWQNIFRTAGPYLADAVNANDLSDLFKARLSREEALRSSSRSLQKP